MPVQVQEGMLWKWMCLLHLHNEDSLIWSPDRIHIIQDSKRIDWQVLCIRGQLCTFLTGVVSLNIRCLVTRLNFQLEGIGDS